MTVLTMLASSQVVARYCLGVATLTFPDLVLTYTVTRLITVRVFTTFIVNDDYSGCYKLSETKP